MGSPRIKGNSDLLLDEALRGAKESGANTEKIILSKLQIKPCQHCDRCLKAKKCVISDDMQKIYSKLKRLDKLILASPVFFMGVPAQAKAMIDRCQVLWVLNYILKQKVATTNQERRALFISVCGQNKQKNFKPLLQTLKIFLKTLQIDHLSTLLFPGIEGKGEILNYPDYLQQAFLSGKELVRK